MTEQPRTRQELYDLVRQRGKQEYILEEMIRLGFWPDQGELPEDPADEIRRSGELRQELEQLYQANARLRDEKKMRQELYKQRLAESKRKRAETKERQEQARVAKAAAWQVRKQQEITYLGAGVSKGLGQTTSRVETLTALGLPILHQPQELANAMGISLARLRFLAFTRTTSKISHYIRFAIPKKTGGLRQISAPMPHLKQAQYWILHHILNPLSPHTAAHGFRCEHSIISNARPHVGQDVVINFDLQDFFPSIAYKRVKGLFMALGYSEALATILGLLCTEPEIAEVELDQQTYFVQQSARYLPQGSPASPAITNILCRRLDKRLTAMSTALGFTYTRYADDLTFSGSGEHLRQICNLLQRTANIVAHEGLQLNPNKTRVLRKSRQQEVTGIVVNQHLNIDKKSYKKFRATLFQIEQDGFSGKTWGNTAANLSIIQGYANFVAMVNPAKGRPFLEQVKRIKAKYC
jgi:retron-type reverse transcriptase